MCLHPLIHSILPPLPLLRWKRCICTLRPLAKNIALRNFWERKRFQLNQSISVENGCVTVEIFNQGVVHAGETSTNIIFCRPRPNDLNWRIPNRLISPALGTVLCFHQYSFFHQLYLTLNLTSSASIKLPVSRTVLKFIPSLVRLILPEIFKPALLHPRGLCYPTVFNN